MVVFHLFFEGVLVVHVNFGVGQGSVAALEFLGTDAVHVVLASSGYDWSS